MHDFDATPNAETELEQLLKRLLGEEPGEPGASSAYDVPATELTELRDLAGQLRAAGRHMGAAASLRVVLAACVRAHRGDSGASLVTSGRGRYGAWVAVAAAVLLGMFGLGAGAVSSGASPSSPWYGARLAIENLQVALTPSTLARAEMLVRNAHARIAEIRAMGATGDSGNLRRAADALDADAGWLHALLLTLPEQQRLELVKVLGQV
jgi:hypothetical protein